MTKKALCVGINYRGTEFELRGCLNDADDWARLLAAHDFDVNVMKEAAATRDNIVSGVVSVVSALGPGDVGFVTYSGHGTWVPDTGGDEPDHRDEALCPVDMGDDGRNLILDDQLTAVLSGLAAGAKLVLVADCCHSGTVYRMFSPAEGRTAYRRPRMIPPGQFPARPGVWRVDRAFGLPARTNAAPPGVIHFSGCKDTETSADADIDGRPCGAFSYYALRAFGRAAALGQSYADAHAAIRKSLPSYAFQQTPLLTAAPGLKQAVVFA